MRQLSDKAKAHDSGYGSSSLTLDTSEEGKVQAQKKGMHDSARTAVIVFSSHTHPSSRRVRSHPIAYALL